MAGARTGCRRWDIENLEETAKLISDAERRSMAAERDTTDRYLAAYLSERVGAEFTGRVSGVQRFGLFVKLDETGADGLIPIRAIGREFFHFDAQAQTLMGADSGLTIGVGAEGDGAAGRGGAGDGRAGAGAAGHRGQGPASGRAREGRAL